MLFLEQVIYSLRMIITEYISDPENNKDVFVEAYEAIDLHVQNRLAETLSNEQMKSFMSWRSELMERIKQIIERYR